MFRSTLPEEKDRLNSNVTVNKRNKEHDIIDFLLWSVSTDMLSVRTHEYIHASKQTNIHAFIHTCVHTYKNTYMNTNMDTFIHTYI
jgi:hypothetical protein